MPIWSLVKALLLGSDSVFHIDDLLTEQEIKELAEKEEKFQEEETRRKKAQREADKKERAKARMNRL